MRGLTACCMLVAVYLQGFLLRSMFLFSVLRFFHVSLFNFSLMFPNSLHCMASIGKD